MHKYASAKECTTKIQKTTVHFGFTKKVYGLLCTATAAINAKAVGGVVAYDQECKAQESLRCKVIMWDEATMSNKLAL